MADEPKKLSLLSATVSSDNIAMGMIRHVLTLGGGYLVAKGITDEATANELIGGAMAFLGFAWSFYVKK